MYTNPGIALNSKQTLYIKYNIETIKIHFFWHQSPCINFYSSGDFFSRLTGLCFLSK